MINNVDINNLEEICNNQIPCINKWHMFRKKYDDYFPQQYVTSLTHLRGLSGYNENLDNRLYYENPYNYYNDEIDTIDQPWYGRKNENTFMNELTRRNYQDKEYFDNVNNVNNLNKKNSIKDIQQQNIIFKMIFLFMALLLFVYIATRI